MASGFFALLDDIAMLMDDTASITKLAIKKTTPLLGDDLAVNAKQASTFQASRELPVLWAITKGSFKNKLIILPFAFLLSAFIPWVIPIILIFGGFYLSFEGTEVVYHYFKYKFLHTNHTQKSQKKLTEAQKIKSAILTDFILSIEIIVVALETVIDKSLMIQIIAVTTVSIVVTIGVYGIVTFLVRLDDMGYFLIKNDKNKGLQSKFGYLLVVSLPKIIKILSVIGTIAMLLVAGGILVHNISFLQHIYSEYFLFLPLMVYDFIISLMFGVVIMVSIKLFKKE